MILKLEIASSRGPSQAVLVNIDKATGTATKLERGSYAFRLNVTDDSGLSSSAILGVNVTRSKRVLIVNEF